MKLPCFAAVAAVIVVFSIPADAQVSVSPVTPPEVILAASKTDHTLAIVDPKSLKVLARMPLGPDPHEIAVSVDGRTAYVSNMENISGHRIDVVDLIAQKTLEPIDTGLFTGPHGLVFIGGKLWFTAQGAKAIVRLDPVTRQIDQVLGTGGFWTHMLVLTRDSKKIYATNIGDGTISLFEQKMVPPLSTARGYVRPGRVPVLDWVHTLIPAAVGVEGMDISPDQKEVWTASPVTGQIFIVDTEKQALVATVDAGIVGANRLKFTPDGSRVLISNFRNGDLVVLDAKSHREVGRVDTGNGASGILISPDGKRAFVGCTFDDNVAVVDLGSLKIVARINVGGAPDGLAWAAR